MRSATSDAKSHRSVRGGVNGRSTTRIHKSDETDILSRQAQHVIEVAPIPSIGGVRATTNPRKKIQQRSSAVRWLTLALLTMPPTYQHSGVPRTAMARVTWGAAAADGGDVGVGDCEDEEAASCTAGGGDGDDDEVLALGRGVLDWVRSQGARGGRVHDLVEVRRVPVPPPRRMGRRRPTPPTTDEEASEAATTILGIVATGRIEEGEIICSIPRGMYIGPTRNGRASNDVESTEDWCQVIRDTAHQMKLGAASDLAPYARYLAAQPRGVVPAFWSDAGRDMLGIVLGDHLPPRDVGDDVDGLEACDGGTTQNGIGDNLLRHAAELVIARSEDLYMTPVFDMINHREGRWCNTYMTLPEYSPTSSFVVTARRTIEAGEQLHVTYSMCELYGGGRRSDGTTGTGEEGPRNGRGFSARVSDPTYPGCGYDTSDVLHDFGFVEQTPQRWILGNDDTEEEVRFDLLDEEEDGGGGSGSGDGVTLSWLRDGGPPSEDMVRFLRSELDRLDVVFVEATRRRQSLQRRGRNSERDDADCTGGDGDCDTDYSDVSIVPKSEWDVIWQYHEALTYAIGRAVAAADEAVET